MLVLIDPRLLIDHETKLQGGTQDKKNKKKTSYLNIIRSTLELITINKNDEREHNQFAENKLVDALNK